MYTNKINKMLHHFMQEYVRDDIYIVLPEGYKYTPEWDSISMKDVRVTKAKEHEVATEWELIVHGVFRFAVVLNQHGYHIQQLQYKPKEVK